MYYKKQKQKQKKKKKKKEAKNKQQTKKVGCSIVVDRGVKNAKRFSLGQ